METFEAAFEVVAVAGFADAEVGCCFVPIDASQADESIRIIVQAIRGPAKSIDELITGYTLEAAGTRKGKAFSDGAGCI